MWEIFDLYWGERGGLDGEEQDSLESREPPLLALEDGHVEVVDGYDDPEAFQLPGDAQMNPNPPTLRRSDTAPASPPMSASRMDDEARQRVVERIALLRHAWVLAFNLKLFFCFSEDVGVQGVVVVNFGSKPTQATTCSRCATCSSCPSSTRSGG